MEILSLCSINKGPKALRAAEPQNTETSLLFEFHKFSNDGSQRAAVLLRR